LLDSPASKTVLNLNQLPGHKQLQIMPDSFSGGFCEIITFFICRPQIGLQMCT